MRAFQGEDLREAKLKVKRTRSVGKRTVASFFGIAAHITTIPLEEGHTVTAGSSVPELV